MSEQERRQHIGNDKALIYFTSEAFEPAFRGNVNCKIDFFFYIFFFTFFLHFFLIAIAFVVQPHKINGNTVYKLSCFYRKRVNRFIPFLPQKTYTPEELRTILIGNGKKKKNNKKTLHIFFF